MILQALKRMEARLEVLDTIEARHDDFQTGLSALGKRISELEHNTPGLKNNGEAE